MAAQRAARPYTHTQKLKLHNRKQLRNVMLAELSKRPKTYVDEVRKSERLAERARCKEKMARKAPAKRKPASLVRTDLDELAPRRKRKAEKAKPAAKPAAKKTTKKPAPKKRVQIRTPKRAAAQAHTQRGLQVYRSRPVKTPSRKRSAVQTDATYAARKRIHEEAERLRREARAYFRAERMKIRRRQFEGVSPHEVDRAEKTLNRQMDAALAVIDQQEERMLGALSLQIGA